MSTNNKLGEIKMHKRRDDFLRPLKTILIKIISETNGISLNDTLELLSHRQELKDTPVLEKSVIEFMKLVSGFQSNEVDIETLLNHPVSDAFFSFFKDFPIQFHEEHIHLTGSLSAEFIYPHLKKLLDGPHKELYEKKIDEVYGEGSTPINSVEDVDRLITLKDGEQFSTYLRILFLPKLILTSRQIHEEAAYHMAYDLYNKYNVGKIRLKFTLSRSVSR